MPTSAVTASVIAAVIAARGFGDGGGNAAVHSVRNTRNALVFPPASVLQLTIGVSTVLDLVGNPSGQMSYALQQNVALPTNYTQLLIPPTVRVKRSFDVRDNLLHFFGRFTTNGTECLKKVICQVSETPLRGGLFEEILSFVFTPSEHEDAFGREKERNPYLVSESVAKLSGDCDSSFPECRQSPLDLISRKTHRLFKSFR